MQLFERNSRSDSFWSKLLEDSNELKKEAHYPKSLSHSFDWESMFKEFFRAFHADSKVREAVKTRLFVGSKKTPELVSRISETPPDADQSLEEWGEALFDSKPWCIVLDKVSGCIEELTTEIALWMAPYYSKLKPGSFSTEISPYIGRYGYTPFGAHVDIDGISILHLHLGPGSKQMTIWPEEDFKRISGSDALNCYDFKPYLKQGSTYNLESGDIFHLPACNHYHVARTDTFSVGITIGLRHENAQSMLKRAMKTYHDDPFKSDIKTVLEQFKWKRESNCGFMRTPLKRDISDETLDGLTFQGKHPFKIVLGNTPDGNTMAFARGRRIPGYIDSAQVDLVGQLNQGGHISCSAIDMDEPSLTFLQQLYSYKAIVPTSDRSTDDKS